jgi:hypothetical protein
MSKSRYLGGEFKRSFIYKNGVHSDKQSVAAYASRASIHTTGDKFQSDNNDYSLFLDDPEELPRLSILDNYKQISRIMTQQYMK